MANIINLNFNPELFYFDQEDTVQARTIESVERGDPIWSKKDQKFPDVKMTTPKNKKNYASEALAGIQEISLLSHLFFSRKNIEEIQKLLRYNVYVNTKQKYIIDSQDETELLIIMRAKYLEFGRVYNKDANQIKSELKRLNIITVNEILPDIITSLEQYAGYIRDSSKPYSLIDRPVNPSIKGISTENRSVSDVLIGDDLFYK